jgi:uncharacterized membrane protein
MTPIRISTGWLKFVLGWAAVFAIRMIPFRPGNFEPMLAVLMPFSKRFGVSTSFAFGFLGIALFDSVTSGIGVWTFVTALAYGALGVAGHLYFRNRAATRRNFLMFGLVGTLAYDVLTGLTIGPIFFGQPLVAAALGQIPFTLMHLAGTAVFTLALSPVLYRWIVTNDALEFNLALSRKAA